ncbi:ATP-binding protein [Pseudoalteromonas sp. McH1-42]|uniref:sensor histidine kinase n=1 Tax=Pseudoalteromonas sp. McH1-42 TaxID=2917752 RepID=UPI001EF54ECC|nr:ATP-binding protein [Pseudoalteromonas sp. McH1-42]MCG7563158.1 ATP-binding protein [Pseudoalteromonas sp. McH1-42]
MFYLKRHPRWLLGLQLGLLCVLISLATGQYLHSGLSATWLLVLLLIAVCCGAIFTLFARQQRQSTAVIRALVNGDSSLRLSPSHPLHQEYDEIRHTMQAARFKAEQQAQFFQALLLHIELAVLVCDSEGKVIESNPAVARLLGKSVSSVTELDQIGALIQSCDTQLKTSAPWQRGEQQDTLSVQISVAQIQGQIRKVITLTSIHTALNSKEQQAYKCLTRVLTHEVANSITPLSSIAQSCRGLLPDALCFDDEDDKDDLILALNTLAARTEHLGAFITRFRAISSLPRPSLSPTSLAPLLERLVALHKNQLSAAGIQCELSVLTKLLVMLDPGQIEQVLINLFTNAVQAIEQVQQGGTQQIDNPVIQLTLAQNEAQQVYVEIRDNGPGVEAHVVEMMFVPFFTTKQQGSGIGLSLSRQIMVSHGGDLVYLQKPQGACFRCVFG